MARIKANWLKNSKIRWGLFTGLWVVLVVMVVVPTWQGVVDRNSEIEDLETRLATMDDWAVAGMWLAPQVRERSLPVKAAYSRLFPAERLREELFLSLAQVADISGVENFTLSEASSSGMQENDVWNDGTAMAQAEDSDAPPTDGGASSTDSDMMVEIPKVELGSYRVKTQFYGDYQRIAHFMNELKNIERALKVHSLVLRPQSDGVQVKLEIDVYVSKTIQS